MTEKNRALLQYLEAALLEIGFDAEPKKLYEPANYLLQIGGKRLRPLVTLLGCSLYTDAKRAIPQALAVEVFHNFTLMHDDIMDAAPLRRGQQTVHKKWDVNTAILSGDAMFAKSFQLLANAEESALPQLMNVFSKTALEVCEGQQRDMDFETQQNVSEAEYIKMIQQKTSVLVGCALQMGAIVGGASVQDQENLYNFGLLLGTAFQIKDDWLDCFGDPQKVGKQVGGDIIANKKTLLLIHATNTATGEEKAALEKWIAATNFIETEKVEAVKSIYKKLDISAFAQQKMDDFYQKALHALSLVSVEEIKKKPLLNFAEMLMQREH